MADEKKDLAELAKQYDASQIQVLEGLEAVRKTSRNVYRLNQFRRFASPCLGNRG